MIEWGGYKMNHKKKLFVFCLILIVLFTVSATSASGNVTNVISNDDSMKIVDDDKLADSGYELNAKQNSGDDWSKIKVFVNNYKKSYTYEDTFEINITNDGEPLDDKRIDVELEGDAEVVPFWGTTNSKGCIKFKLADAPAGRYDIHVFIGDHDFYADKTLKIDKSGGVKMSAKKWISTTKSVTVLKVAVKEKRGYYVQDGVVKFKINGKTYNARVNDGIAIKKIKLKKAKNYNYRATFVSKNYITKSATSKVYVKKAKSYYTIKAGKYSIKLPYKKYLKLINAKNHHKNGYVSLKTGKFYYYNAPTYKTVYTKKTKWVYKKVLSYESFYYNDGTYDSYSYSLSKYYRAGWQWYGSYDKSFSDGYESYAKLKKKVTYTVSKQVRNGYKSAKSPIYVMVELLPKDGQIKKGDYIRAWTAGGGEMGKRLAFNKIDFYTYSP